LFQLHLKYLFKYLLFFQLHLKYLFVSFVVVVITVVIIAVILNIVVVEKYSGHNIHRFFFLSIEPTCIKGLMHFKFIVNAVY